MFRRGGVLPIISTSCFALELFFLNDARAESCYKTFSHFTALHQQKQRLSRFNVSEFWGTSIQVLSVYYFFSVLMVCSIF